MPIQNELIPCNFCGSEKFSTYDTMNQWVIVQCNRCGFHFTNPRPPIDSLSQYYSEEYFKDERHISNFYHQDGTPKADGINYTNRVMDAESYITQRGKILELGAARGGFLNVMAQRGWQVSGVEISQDACNQAKQLYQLDLFCGTLDEFNTTETYDVISMYQTLEHVPNPKYVIERSYDLLNNDGIIVIEVPNLHCFEMRYSHERRRLSYDLPRHLNHFTPAFLTKELKKASFDIIDIIRNEDIWVGNYLSRKNTRVRETAENKESLTADKKSNNQHHDIPLLKHSSGIKHKILQRINQLLPGWRFTIIGRKRA